MPASSFDMYYMQDARNNFDAIRPAPICADANQFVGQCQNIHISTNCYYGYHDPKSIENAQVASATDCEMVDLQPTQTNGTAPSASPQSNARKRAADDGDYPDSKRLREEVQRENTNEPETTERMLRVASDEQLESLYWNTHGGNVYHLIQCL